VLSNLGPLDVLWVAAAAGVSEELLFRGALIPATFPDWRALPPEHLCRAAPPSKALRCHCWCRARLARRCRTSGSGAG